MTHKQIIIDGVDVSGCGYFDDNECMIAGLGINEAILYCHCKSNHNCYYKNWKRSLIMNDDEIRRTIEYYEGCEPKIQTVATNIVTYANGDKDYEYDDICINCPECDEQE